MRFLSFNNSSVVTSFSLIITSKLSSSYMPVAGVDGTLSDRMRDADTRGKVWAKTGTVTGVSSLAGYCQAPNGHLLCFAIINQGVMHGKNAHRFQDKVCEALCLP